MYGKPSVCWDGSAVVMKGLMLYSFILWVFVHVLENYYKVAVVNACIKYIY